jgi:hypothetical protein
VTVAVDPLPSPEMEIDTLGGPPVPLAVLGENPQLVMFPPELVA